MPLVDGVDTGAAHFRAVGPWHKDEDDTLCR